MQSENNTNELIVLLDDRIAEARRLLDKIVQIFDTQRVVGVGKLRNKIMSELKFLQDLKLHPQRLLIRHLETSNLTHFVGIVDAAKDRNCIAVMRSFNRSAPMNGRGGCTKLDVDLVADEGAQWIKVVSRNSRSLHQECVGAYSGSGRSIVDQARDYIATARLHPHLFRPPKVTFVFASGVPNRLAIELRSFGVDIETNQITSKYTDAINCNNNNHQSTTDLTSDDDNLSSSDDDVIADNCGEIEQLTNVSYSSIGDDAINLDITAILVLVSELTHTGGADYEFKETLLNCQAAMERERPAMPTVMQAIKDKQLMICQTAYESAQSILTTVGGEGEKRRAVELFSRANIVADAVSERASRLKLSDKISSRAKIIFGSGDYYRAVTLTANRHFVQASAHQGVNFAVILHESRALSEQKQAHAKRRLSLLSTNLLSSALPQST